MRMLIQATFPNETIRTFIREGVLKQKIGRVIEHIEPEAVYFSNDKGKRSTFMVVNVEESADIPGLVEPLYLTFNADIEFRTCMTQEDMGKIELAQIGKTWG